MCCLLLCVVARAAAAIFCEQDIYVTAVRLRAGGLPYYQWDYKPLSRSNRGLHRFWILILFGQNFLVKYPECKVLDAECSLQRHAVQCAFELQGFL